VTRPLRIDFNGAVHHVTARGNERRPIVIDDDDRIRFVSRLGETVESNNVVLHAYCLMNNHFHLLLETPEGNLSRAMHALNGRHAQDINRRHRRVGHLFQGRFASRLIQKERYLLAVCRYVLLNPVRAGIVRKAAEWPWSSYRATAGLVPAESFLAIDWLLARFHPSDRHEATRDFRAFVAPGGEEIGPLPRDWSNRPILGDDAFVERFRGPLRAKADIREIARRERFAARPPLDRIFPDPDSGLERNERIESAVLMHGYRAVDVARFLGIHDSTVSKILRARSQDPRPDPGRPRHPRHR
jgi:REP element-mobilizing transposase RayT